MPAGIEFGRLILFTVFTSRKSFEITCSIPRSGRWESRLLIPSQLEKLTYEGETKIVPSRFLTSLDSHNPANSYLFKDNSENTRKRCEICSKLTTKTPKRRQWRRFGVFIVILGAFKWLKKVRSSMFWKNNYSPIYLEPLRHNQIRTKSMYKNQIIKIWNR